MVNNVPKQIFLNLGFLKIFIIDLNICSFFYYIEINIE